MPTAIETQSLVLVGGVILWGFSAGALLYYFSQSKK